MLALDGRELVGVITSPHSLARVQPTSIKLPTSLACVQPMSIKTSNLTPHPSPLTPFFRTLSRWNAGAQVAATDKKAPPPEVKLPFVDAFVSSLMMIVVSELGDKTFFIAAVPSLTSSN